MRGETSRTIVVAAVAAVLGGALIAPQTAGAADANKDVRVVNTASEQVPVTGSVNIGNTPSVTLAGTPTVTVGNGSSQPVPVTVENRAQGPIDSRQAVPASPFTVSGFLFPSIRETFFGPVPATTRLAISSVTISSDRADSPFVTLGIMVLLDPDATCFEGSRHFHAPLMQIHSPAKSVVHMDFPQPIVVPREGVENPYCVSLTAAGGDLNPGLTYTVVGYEL